MKTNKMQIERLEEELAEEEYHKSFMELLPNDKVSIHNKVLEQVGLRRSFKFTCIDCGKLFTDDIEGGLVDILTDVQSETHSEVLESLCGKCKAIKDRELEGEE